MYPYPPPWRPCPGHRRASRRRLFDLVSAAACHPPRHRVPTTCTVLLRLLLIRRSARAPPPTAPPPPPSPPPPSASPLRSGFSSTIGGGFSSSAFAGCIFVVSRVAWRHAVRRPRRLRRRVGTGPNCDSKAAARGGRPARVLEGEAPSRGGEMEPGVARSRDAASAG